VTLRVSLRAVVAAVAVAACGSRPTAQRSETAHRWLVPAQDTGESCADVGDRRVCWNDSGAPTSARRDLPPVASPVSLGFRCFGQGAARECEVRDTAPPFSCDGATCTQRHPRQPDEGQWQCSDDAGIAVCASVAAAAGVPEGRVERGWMCGQRSGHHDGSRVCIDLSPDFPDGVATGWRCRWSHEGATLRLCIRDREAHSLGDACDRQHPCIAGARCAAGRCEPPQPAPGCTLDGDCERNTCRFGTCLADRP
jgi:hypothetical protein